MPNDKTPRPSHSFVKSVDVNPNDYLQNGETMEQAKQRLLGVTKVIVEKGLSMRNGQLCFGFSDDMKVAKKAAHNLTQNDMNLMYHANDSLMNAMGAFIGSWSLSLLPPAKPNMSYNPEKDLPFIKTALENVNSLLKGTENGKRYIPQ